MRPVFFSSSLFFLFFFSAICLSLFRCGVVSNLCVHPTSNINNNPAQCELFQHNIPSIRMRATLRPPQRLNTERDRELAQSSAGRPGIMITFIIFEFVE